MKQSFGDLGFVKSRIKLFIIVIFGFWMDVRQTYFQELKIQVLH